MDGQKEFAFCKLCSKEGYYSMDYSTSILTQHMKRHHKQVYKQHLEDLAEAKLAMEGKVNAQKS